MDASPVDLFSYWSGPSSPCLIVLLLLSAASTHEQRTVPDTERLISFQIGLTARDIRR